MIRIERARAQLEMWAVATGGSFTVTVQHLAEWHARVILSCKGAQWVVARYSHTEVGALEFALTKAAIEAKPWAEHLNMGVNAPYVPHRWHKTPGCALRLAMLC